MTGVSVDRTAPPPASRRRAFAFPDFEVGSRSGIDLYLLPRRTLPLAHLELVVAHGADGEPAHARGLATLAAGLLDEGTARRTSQEIAAAAEALGSEVQANADWDGTYLEITVRSEHVAAGLELLFELLSEATFPEVEVERLKRRRLAELRRRSTHPDFLAAREMLHSLYADHVYGESLLGVAPSVEALDRDDVAAWYGQRLRPAPTSLLITGHFDRAEVIELVGRAERGQGRSTIVDPPAVDRRSGRSIRVVDRPQAGQTELRIGHPGISRAHPDRVVTQVLNCVLGGKFTSRLNLSLRERLGITYGAWSRFSSRRGPGPFVAGAAVDNGAAGLAAREILLEMDRLRREPVPADELGDAKTYLIGTFPYSLQALDGLAGRLEDLTLHPALARDSLQRWPAEVDAVEREAVLRAAEAHLHPLDATIVAVGPAREIAPQLSALGPVEVVPTVPS